MANQRRYYSETRRPVQRRYEYEESIHDGNAVRKPAERPKSKPKHMQTRRQREKLLKMTEKQIRKARRSGINWVKAVSTTSLVVIGFVLIFEVIFANVQLNELTTEINSAQSELAQLQGTEVQLQMQQSSGKTGTELENYAKNQLGMTKVKNDQVVYVNLNEGDTAIIEDGGSGGNILQKIWNTVSSWFE